MSISEKLVTIAENQEKVYKSGQSSMIDESKIIKKSVSGEYISVDDVSEIPHEVKVQLTSGGKNLFDGEFVQGGLGSTTKSRIYSTLDIEIKENTTYTISTNLDLSVYKYALHQLSVPPLSANWDAVIQDSSWQKVYNPYTILSSINGYLGIYIGKNDESEILPDEMENYWFQIEEGVNKNLFDINSSENIIDCRIAISNGGTYGQVGQNVSHYIPVEGNKSYIMFNDSVTLSYASWYDKDKGYISGGGIGSKKIQTAPENACYIRFDYPATDTIVQFYELHEPSAYEPYKEILTDYSGVSFNTCGKNLLNQAEMKTGTQSGVTLEYLEDEDCFLLNGTAESTTNRFVTYIFKEGVQNANYTISTTYISGTIETEGLNALVYLAESEINTGGFENWLNTRLGNNNNSNTKKLNKKYISAFWLYLNVGVKFNNYKFRIQLEHGSQSTPYEKFNGQTLTANSDGTVEGVEYLSPYMYMTTDNPNVTINATYHKSYGMQTEYDRFWDSYQDGGKRTNYSFGFGGRGWTDETFKPKYPNLPPFEGQTYMFQDARMSEIDIDLQFTLIANIDYMFAYNSNLKRVKSVTLHASAKGGDSCFREATALEDVTFKNDIPCSFNFQWSTKLSKATILNIFEHLSSTVTGQTLTLSKTAVTNAFGSTTATEWTNLVATKTNWTISLV